MNDNYVEYLQTRSAKSKLYRKYWLYPKLCRYLTGKVLDIGCGIGDFLHFRNNTTGVDIDPSIVSFCQAQGLDVVLIRPGHLPFDEGGFDGVVLDNVIEHLDAPSELLSEIHRVLRPYGTFIVGVPGPKGYSHDPDHKVFYDEKDLQYVVEKSGFILENLLHMPIKSNLARNIMRQYCIYGVFSRA